MKIHNRSSHINSMSIRTVRYKKHSLGLFISQSLNMLIGIFMVPLMLNGLGNLEYGVWVTILATIEWLNFFDFGLGNGLRNKYVEAKVDGNFEQVRIFVSTAFYMLAIIAVSLVVVFKMISIWFDWSILFAAPNILKKDVNAVIQIVIVVFAARFVVNIVNILLTADQMPAIPAFLSLIGSCLSFLIVFVLNKSGTLTMRNAGICISLSQLLPTAIAFVYLFNSRYSKFSPKLKYFNASHVRNIFSLGLKFFLVQVTALFLFQSNNLILAHACNPTSVTEYNIAYKYLSVIYVAYLAMLSPLWSATTEAFLKDDQKWILSTVNKLKKLWILMCFVGAIMIILSPYLYRLWLKDSVSINMSTTILMCIYFLSLMRTSIFRYFINGIGRIRLQVYVTIIQALLHLPLAFFFTKGFGLKGVLIIMIMWNVVNVFWEPKQFKLLVNGTANGIWNK